jgi:hypothetical protein
MDYFSGKKTKHRKKENKLGNFSRNEQASDRKSHGELYL